MKGSVNVPGSDAALLQQLDAKVQEVIDSNQAILASLTGSSYKGVYSSSTAYSAGDVVLMDVNGVKKLVTAKVDIAAGDAYDASNWSDFEAATPAEETVVTTKIMTYLQNSSTGNYEYTASSLPLRVEYQDDNNSETFTAASWSGSRAAVTEYQDAQGNWIVLE